MLVNSDRFFMKQTQTQQTEIQVCLSVDIEIQMPPIPCLETKNSVPVTEIVVRQIYCLLLIIILTLRCLKR